MAYTSEKDLNVFLENNFEVLNTKLESWYGTLMAQNAVIVAIARKAPRLLGYCQNKFPHLYNPNVKIISDIAIPFVDWKNTSKRCLVIDEAIYHGTTFEKVLDVLSKVINDADSEVKGMPLVITQDALNAPKIVDSLVEGWNLIDGDKCNFFIDSIISKFFDLGKPYDIEYPLFYLSLPKGKYSYEELDENIESVLKLMAADEEEKFNKKPTFFKNMNYRREDGQTFSAFTYCTDYIFDEYQETIKPDFSKLRIFHTDDSICIASMAPHTINIKNLETSNNMFVGKMGEAWNLILKKAKDINSKEDKNVEHQTQKSLVIFANYLLSANHFMRLKRKLERLFAAVLGYDVDFFLNAEDIQLLAGIENAEYVRDLLMALKSFEDIYTPFKESNTIDSLIPLMYKKNYLMQLTLDNMFDKKTVGSIVSNVFSDLHWMVEVKSRRQPRSTYDRLEFGESLSSISELCTGLLPEQSTTENIHKNIDMRIDRGSMVPDYVCVNDAYDTYWKRMFRSGENEDLTRDQHFRICINILSLYLSKINSTSISSDELKLLFTLLAKDENIFSKKDGEYNGIFASKMSVAYKNGDYRVQVIQNDEITDLLEKLEDYHIISETDNSRFDMAQSSYANLLSSGLPLSDKQNYRILRVVDFVAYAHRNIDEAIISELKNYACFSEKAVEKAFDEWKAKIVSFLKEDSNEEFIELCAAFADLYVSVPEPQLEVGKNLFASSEVGTWMKGKVASEEIHHYSQSMIDKMHAAFYILNLWAKYKGDSPSTYYNASMFDGFKTLLSYSKHIDGFCAIADLLTICGPKISIDCLATTDKTVIQEALCSLLTML